MPLVVLVDLVGGYSNYTPNALQAAQSVKQVRSAHHIGCEGFYRLQVTVPDQCLCSQMKNHLWLGLLDQVSQCIAFAYVTKVTSGKSIFAQRIKKVGCC